MKPNLIAKLTLLSLTTLTLTSCAVLSAAEYTGVVRNPNYTLNPAKNTGLVVFSAQCPSKSTNVSFTYEQLGVSEAKKIFLDPNYELIDCPAESANVVMMDLPQGRYSISQFDPEGFRTTVRTKKPLDMTFTVSPNRVTYIGAISMYTHDNSDEIDYRVRNQAKRDISILRSRFNRIPTHYRVKLARFK